MSVMFRVWNAVIYLSMAEPRSVMHNSDQGNRGIGCQEWNGAEWSGIRIIGIKIKEKCDIITVLPNNSPCPHGLTIRKHWIWAKNLTHF